MLRGLIFLARIEFIRPLRFFAVAFRLAAIHDRQPSPFEARCEWTIRLSRVTEGRLSVIARPSRFGSVGR